jgi:hypothetical protein
MFFKKQEKKSSSKDKPSIFDDFSILMDNIELVEDIDLKNLNIEEHEKAIHFYTFCKFKRFIQNIAK